jgi:hypothetical protein
MTASATRRFLSELGIDIVPPTIPFAVLVFAAAHAGPHRRLMAVSGTPIVEHAM